MNVPVESGRPAEPIPVRRRSGELVRTTGFPPLNAQTRCDRCGARAWAAARFPGAASPLLFCAHHFRRWEAAIRSAAVAVLDDRERLLAEVRAQAAHVATSLLSDTSPKRPKGK